MFQSCCNGKKIITLNCVCIHGKQLAEKEAGSSVSKCNKCKSDKNILPQSLQLRGAHQRTWEKRHSSAFNGIVI